VGDTVLHLTRAVAYYPYREEKNMLNCYVKGERGLVNGTSLLSRAVVASPLCKLPYLFSFPLICSLSITVTVIHLLSYLL
jgi:hypothetical protein